MFGYCATPYGCADGIASESTGQPDHECDRVRVRDDEVLISDGPFAETKDFVGGVVAIAREHLDEAVQIAASHPYARRGSVEIRPVWE